MKLLPLKSKRSRPFFRYLASTLFLISSSSYPDVSEFPVDRFNKFLKIKDCSIRLTQAYPKLQELFRLIRANDCKQKLIEPDESSWIYGAYLQYFLKRQAKAKRFDRLYLEKVLKKLELISSKKDKEDFLIRELKNFKKGTPLHKELERSLWELAPRLSPDSYEVDAVLRAEDLRLNRRYKEAFLIYQKLWKLPKYSAKQLGLKELKDLHFRFSLLKKYLYGYSEYNPFSKKMMETFRDGTKEISPNEHLMVDHGTRYLRGIWTKGNPAKAYEVVKELIKRTKDDSNLAYLYWLKAKIELEYKWTLKAIANFDQAISKLKYSEDNKRLYEKILWSSAFTYYNENRLTEYRNLFKVHKDIIQSSLFKQKILYWYGKLLIKNKKKSEANKIFKSIVNINSYGYYALLSSQRLYGKIKTHDKLKKKESGSPHWVFLLEDQSLQKMYLNYLVSKRPDIDYGVQIAYDLQSQEKYYDSLLFLYDYPQKELETYLFSDPRLFYPYAFKERLKGLPLDPLMALAIIKRESLYNPNAVSSANALGLMQVLPKVAKKMVSSVKSEEDALIIENNILAGTRYFSKLLTRFNRSYVKSIAGYNAGPSMVKKWQRTVWKNSNDWELNIENIPYSETRKYVKKVLRNYINYKRIYEITDINLDKYL
ncbi:MAG: lytic transglycosylase domain-containing protein [Bacteriovoracaceae bacterium]